MTASTRSYYGPIIPADEVGLARWQFERAEAAGMLPKPGHARGWLPEQLDTLRQLVPVIVKKFGAEHPIGAGRCADRLAERLGLDVDPADISALAEKGHLAVVDVFYKKGRSHDLYAPPTSTPSFPSRYSRCLTSAPPGWSGRCRSTRPRSRWAGTIAS